MKRIISLIPIAIPVIILSISGLVAFNFAAGVESVDTITGVASIVATCGIDLAGVNTLDYGIMEINQITNQATQPTIEVFNIGTINGNLEISGEDWLDGNSISRIDVTESRYSTSSSVDYAGKTSLTNSDTFVSIVSPQQEQILYFQVQATITTLPFSGSLTQDTNLTMLC